MVTQTGAPRSFSSRGQRIEAAAPDYAKAWNILMSFATPEVKALMYRALGQAKGDTKG